MIADAQGSLALLNVGVSAIGDVERALRRDGCRWVIGVDEAGRGPLAGPVTVAAVVADLEDLAWTDGVDDSKRLDGDRRSELFATINERAVAHAVISLSPAEIDTLNILGATLEGMRRAIEGARSAIPAGDEAVVLVDGNRPVPGVHGAQRCLVRGDSRSLAIAAASILAKVTRDREMERLATIYPGYGLERHKGYPTRAHIEALRRLGPSPIHRRSFGPVAALL